MTKEIRRSLDWDVVEARAVLRRAIANGKPESAKIAAQIEADPELFARFVALRRDRRLNRKVTITVSSESIRTSRSWWATMKEVFMGFWRKPVAA